MYSNSYRRPNLKGYRQAVYRAIFQLFAHASPYMYTVHIIMIKHNFLLKVVILTVLSMHCILVFVFTCNCLVGLLSEALFRVTAGILDVFAFL